MTNVQPSKIKRENARYAALQVKLETALQTLEDIEKWFENKGFIEGVHYDEASILAQIKETLK